MSFDETVGHRVIEMPPGNPGYDLQVFAPGSDEPSFVEVKGLSDAWGASGIGLTPKEFATARSVGSRYWLYVVEFARDPAKARIYRIQDPANRIDEFRFDSGWAAAAEGSATGRPDPLTPTVGMELCDDAGAPIGRILRVNRFGELFRLELGQQDGRSRVVVFSPGKHTLRGDASVPPG